MFDIKMPERPSRSLKLFELDGAWRQCGCLYGEDRGKCGDAWDAYAHGYREVVQCLTKAVERNEFSADTFGYPIFFLVHQYLELRMKEIIKNGRPLIGNNGQVQKGHDLTQLWEECKKILKGLEGWRYYNELNDEARQTYLTLDHFIREMNRDPQGQSFRYPVDRDGTPLLNDDSIQALNVKNLATVFEWVSSMLDGISTGIDEEQKARAEYRAEFEEEYT
jgi:HEPN domain-containing protein